MFFLFLTVIRILTTVALFIPCLSQFLCCTLYLVSHGHLLWVNWTNWKSLERQNDTWNKQTQINAKNNHMGYGNFHKGQSINLHSLFSCVTKPKCTYCIIPEFFMSVLVCIGRNGRGLSAKMIPGTNKRRLTQKLP